MRSNRLLPTAVCVLGAVSLVAPRVQAQTCCSAVSDGVIAWWSLDETQGSTAGEYTGQHPGVHVGQPTPATGMVYGALHFDGIDDYVSIPDHDHWTFTGDFTIELWANWDTPIGSSNPQQALVAHDQIGVDPNKWIFFTTRCGSPYTPSFVACTGASLLVFHINYPNSNNSGSGEWIAVPFVPETNRWYHLAVVRSADTYFFYVDGVEVGNEVNSTQIPASNSELSIGEAEGGMFMDGLLDEVTLYDRALSPVEIQAIHASGSAGKCPGVGEPYCMSGLSASGCAATVSAHGNPSASATSGFCLSVSSVEGAKDGMFFYGVNGRQAVPWGTGYQCVVPPVKRGGLMPGVGTANACDVLFSQDLNARWCSTCPRPLHNPGVGAVVQAQFWYRDPWNTASGIKTTSLSDAIEFTVGP